MLELVVYLKPQVLQVAQDLQVQRVPLVHQERLVLVVLVKQVVLQVHQVHQDQQVL
jgi:hypothetical protein